MKLKLLHEWMGHPEGSVVQMNDRYANDMIKRGVAKEYKEQHIESPPADKATEEAPVQKVLRERKQK